MQIEIKGKPPVDVKNAILVVEGVTRSLCQSTGRDPAEGLMMLLTAAAHMGNLYLAGTVKEKQTAIATALGSAIVAADDFFRLRDTPGIPANHNSVITKQTEYKGNDPAACACTKIQQDETCPVGYPSLLCDICDGKGVVSVSAGRAAVLEDAARIADRFFIDQIVRRDECLSATPPNCEGALTRARQAQTAEEIAAAIRALCSPVHADAGKSVEGDGGADLERYWRPISEADKSIMFEQTYDLDDSKSMAIRNSDHYWVRDADGRVYEATWSDHKNGYWWDLEGESPVDPVEYMPHPLSLCALQKGFCHEQ